MLHQHFYFTGDGRSDGTEQGSSGLGDAQTLATSILGNIAALLVNAGWQPINKTFTNTDCVAKKVGTTDIYVDIDTTNSVVEMPLKYTTSLGDTKLYLTYAWSNNRHAILDHFGDTSAVMGWITLGSAASRSCPRGVSFLYVPPTCTAGQECKISSIASVDYGSGTVNGLPYANTSGATYNFHLLTDKDFVALFLAKGNWTSYNRFKGFCYGPLISTLYDSTDIAASYKYKSYGSMSFGEFEADENSTPNTRAAFLGHIDSYIDEFSNTPYFQFYNSDGTLIVCNNNGTSSSLGSNKCLFYANKSILNALNAPHSDHQNIFYSQILVGGLPFTPATNPNGQPKVSANGYVKGILNPDYLLSVGTANNGGNSRDPMPIGQMFGSKSYCHLGSGILIGWDATSTIGLLDNSDNPMAAVTTA